MAFALAQNLSFVAVLCGLLMAWQEGFSRLHISVDSEVVVKVLSGGVDRHYPYIHTVRRCRELMDRSSCEVTNVIGKQIGHVIG